MHLLKAQQESQLEIDHSSQELTRGHMSQKLLKMDWHLCVYFKKKASLKRWSCFSLMHGGGTLGKNPL